VSEYPTKSNSKKKRKEKWRGKEEKAKEEGISRRIKVKLAKNHSREFTL